MRTINLAFKDLKQILRDWKSAVFLVVMPVIFTLFFGIIFNQGDSGDSRLPVAFNASPSDTWQSKFIDLLATSNAVDPQPVESATRQELGEAVADGDYAGAIILGDDFTRAVQDNDAGEITLIADIATPAGRSVQEAVEKARDRFRSSLRIAGISLATYQQKSLAMGVDQDAYRAEAFDLAVEAWQHPPVTLHTEMGIAQDAQGVEMGFTQSSPGMIVQFAIFGLITSAMVLVIERKSGAMKRLLTTPMRRVELVGGHVLAMFILVLLQQIILILLGQFAFGVDYARAPLAILLMVLALAFWASSLGLFIGAISKTEEQVVTTSMIAMFVFASLGGAWFPLEFAGEAFSTVGHFMPTAWAMDGFQNVIVRGMGLNSVLMPAGMIAAFGAVFFALAVWRFKYE
ncbi:MAG: ABC transporter permease [Anaerolineales bacterium]|jgi:ABC-2 type transport system permease protein